MSYTVPSEKSRLIASRIVIIVSLLTIIFSIAIIISGCTAKPAEIIEVTIDDTLVYEDSNISIKMSEFEAYGNIDVSFDLHITNKSNEIMTIPEIHSYVNNIQLDFNRSITSEIEPGEKLDKMIIIKEGYMEAVGIERCVEEFGLNIAYAFGEDDTPLNESTKTYTGRINFKTSEYKDGGYINSSTIKENFNELYNKNGVYVGIRNMLNKDAYESLKNNGMEDGMVYPFEVYIENNSDRTIYLDTNDIKIDSIEKPYMVIVYEEVVLPGTKSYFSVRVAKRDLGLLGINKLSDIEGKESEISFMLNDVIKVEDIKSIVDSLDGIEAIEESVDKQNEYHEKYTVLFDEFATEQFTWNSKWLKPSGKWYT